MLTKEEKNEIASLELRTLLDAPIDHIRVTVKDYNWIDRLFMRPKYKDFVIYKTRVCNMGRCAEIAYRITEVHSDIQDVFDMIKVSMPLIKEHRKDILYLIAACIQNNSKEPKKSLIKFLDDNLHGDSLNELTSSCLLNSGLMSFTAATAILKGVSVAIVQDTDADHADSQG